MLLLGALLLGAPTPPGAATQAANAARPAAPIGATTGAPALGATTGAPAQGSPWPFPAPQVLPGAKAGANAMGRARRSPFEVVNGQHVSNRRLDSPPDRRGRPP